MLLVAQVAGAAASTLSDEQMAMLRVAHAARARGEQLTPEQATALQEGLETGLTRRARAVMQQMDALKNTDIPDLAERLERGEAHEAHAVESLNIMYAACVRAAPRAPA